MSKHPISLTPVDSSNIRAIGWDSTTKTLAVQFKSGGTYHYPGVDAKLHQQLMAAPSVGGFFASHLRQRKDFADATHLYRKS
jgi:hypothetical protein